VNPVRQLKNLAARRVTALLRSERNAPHGLRWRHVHETPIPQ
jgi:hypothetical protein